MKDNVTPIGHKRDNVKVYIEQKALELLESCQDPDSKTQQIFYLLGREYHLGLQRVFVIRCVLEGSVQEDTLITVSPEELRSVDQQRSTDYPGLRLIGWALYQPGHGTKVLSRHSRCHIQYFRQTSVLLLQDPRSSRKELYLWNGSVFQNLGGLQVYQEQELDIDISNENTPVELWSEPGSSKARSDARESMLSRVLKDNPESSAPHHLLNDDTPSRLLHYTMKEAIPHYTERSKEPRQFEEQLQSIMDSSSSSHDKKKKWGIFRTDTSNENNAPSLSMLTSISAIVLLITVITGALMFHNLSTLSAIQTHVETINHRISYIEQSETVIEETPSE